ncbi:MAG: IclR family transcriptional regulator [Thermodesulfobacteriota bacterium]
MTIQSVNRALDILFLFSDTHPHLGITEISNQLGLTKPTVHALVRTLTHRGFLQQDQVSRKYALGLKIFELGTFLAGTMKINQMGSAVAQRLAEATRQVIRIAIWDQNTMLVTLNVFPGARENPFQQLGPRVPAYCSASGKAVLSALSPKALNRYLKQITMAAFTPYTITRQEDLLKEVEDARLKGYASDREEFMLGIACISAPIFDHAGNPTAAISISSIPSLLFSDNTAPFVEALQHSAGEISSRLGYNQNML